VSVCHISLTPRVWVSSPLVGEACPEPFDFAQDKLRRRRQGEGAVLEGLRTGSEIR
jgi:hypothetical protein